MCSWQPRLGKIVTRKYADNSKHIYPFARWELFDPEKDVIYPDAFGMLTSSVHKEGRNQIVDCIGRGAREVSTEQCHVY